MGTISQHQLASFTSPVNGTSPIDANQVRGNDNSIRSSYNAHDADATIHLQSGAVASRPSASTAGQTWLATDAGAVYLYLDNGSSWVEINYLRSTGGTLSGGLTISSGGLTVSSGATAVQALTATTVTASLDVLIGTDHALRDGTGASLVARNNTTGVVQLGSGTVGDSLSFATNGTVRATMNAAGDLLINTNKFTVAGATGNTSIAGTLGVTGAMQGSTFAGANPSPSSLHQVLSSTGTTTGAIDISLANTGNSTLVGVESSAGGVLFSGTSAYSTIVGTGSARSLHLVTNNAVRLTADSAGAVTIPGTLGVTGAITASGGVVGALTGNASTATALQTARTINGTSFDGTANITVTAAAGTLTGTTLNSSVVTSSLSTVGGLVGIGGLTSAFPALKNMGSTILAARLGDDSTYANFQAGVITAQTQLTVNGSQTSTGSISAGTTITAGTSIGTGNPTGGTSAFWKLGSRVAASVTLVTTQYIEVDIGGTLYKLATVS